MELREVSESIIRIAAQCERTDHSFCGGTEACNDFREFVSGSGQDFDAGRLLLNCGYDCPDQSWSTAALLRLVSEAIDGRESKPSRRRTIRLTSALARLGERGLGADMVLRTWLGERLIRHAMMELVLRYYVSESSFSGDGPFTPWEKTLGEELNEEEGARPAGLSQLMLIANEGPLRKLANRWRETAAVSHLVDYRVSGYTETDVEQSDLVLPAGEDATIWVFERLTVTYLNQWSASSLMWELAYLDNSHRVVERLGVPASILSERHISVVDIVSELSNRLLIRGVVGDVIEGMTDQQRREQVVKLLQVSDYGGALDLARRAVRRAPGDARCSLILACCLMATTPLGARLILEQIKSEACNDSEGLHHADETAILVDLATIYLVEERLKDFDFLFEEIENRNLQGWFWDPCEYVRGGLVFREFDHLGWLAKARTAKERIMSR